MQAETARHATDYPFAIPAESYLLEGGRWSALPGGARAVDLGGRVPVLACGSNQSPEQLARKFADGPRGPIPVTRALLEGFDAVYSAHFSRYGAIPATLQHCPGTTVALSVTWLTPVQERRMHDTEAVGVNYDYGRLEGVTLEVDGGLELHHPLAYVSRWGCLTEGGMPLALAAVDARARRWRALDQTQVLDLVRARLAPGESLETFVAEGAESKDVRRIRTEALSATTQPFSYPGFVPVP